MSLQEADLYGCIWHGFPYSVSAETIIKSLESIFNVLLCHFGNSLLFNQSQTNQMVSCFFGHQTVNALDKYYFDLWCIIFWNWGFAGSR